MELFDYGSGNSNQTGSEPGLNTIKRKRPTEISTITLTGIVVTTT